MRKLYPDALVGVTQLLCTSQILMTNKIPDFLKYVKKMFKDSMVSRKICKDSDPNYTSSGFERVKLRIEEHWIQDEINEDKVKQMLNSELNLFRSM
jgi:hypothetical protein